MLMLLQAVPPTAMPVTTELTSVVTAGAISVSVIQWLKNTKLIPFINHNSAALNRAVAWLMAFISAIGLHYTWDSGTGTLTLTGLTATAIGTTLWATIKSYAFQVLIYRGIVDKNGKPVQAAQEPAPAQG